MLVIGESGPGKSTFIDAMINYIAGVSYHDEFRFTMVNPSNIDEPQKCKKDLSQLRTAMTCYRIPWRKEFNIDFSLNIIDTPGFEDTRVESDYEHIPLQIKHVLQSVNGMVHSVCIVVPSSKGRLHIAEQRAFTSILDLFDAGIHNNIHPCLTFYDGRDGYALSTLEAAGIPFEKYFQFDNSYVFNMGHEVLNETFKRNWCDRMKSFKDFFSEIGKVSPQRLKN